MKEAVPKNNDTVEIDLIKLFMAYLHKWWLILLCALVVGGGALLYTMKFITPLYQASITIYVNNVRSGERIDYISGAICRRRSSSSAPTPTSSRATPSSPRSSKRPA